MGGENAQKSKMARERNLEKQKGGKGSQLEANKKAMSLQVCMQTFICTTSEVNCREHAEAQMFPLKRCIPGGTQALNNLGGANKASSGG